MNPKQARDRLDGLWRRGLECLGTRYAIMGGAMTWVSERHLVLTMSRHRRPAASYPEAAKRRSYVAPSYESKY